LPPAQVDDESGYRFYDAKSVQRAHVITQLRALDFSLRDVAEVLSSCSEEDDQKEGITTRELPAGRCVYLVHKGPYEELGRSYERLFALRSTSQRYRHSFVVRASPI